MSALRTFATIRFEGDALVPSLLSSAFGVRPTLAYAKGEPYTLGRRNIRKIGQTGCWFLNTSDRVEAIELDVHIAFLTRMLTGGETLRDEGRVGFITGAGAARLLVTLFWFGRAGAAIPAVDLRFSRLIGDLHGEIETDFSTQSGEPGAFDGWAAQA